MQDWKIGILEYWAKQDPPFFVNQHFKHEFSLSIYYPTIPSFHSSIFISQYSIIPILHYSSPTLMLNKGTTKNKNKTEHPPPSPLRGGGWGVVYLYVKMLDFSLKNIK